MNVLFGHAAEHHVEEAAGHTVANYNGLVIIAITIIIVVLILAFMLPRKTFKPGNNKSTSKSEED